ncbi:MAG: hypothetical protein JW891_13675 [Candidatus Lokiarchaeota archaeon]|nr:hypothetical protein [Candidatus Lokiarchaeota archaeon]
MSRERDRTLYKKKLKQDATWMGKMGYKDPDLKSMSHDKIITWLYKEETIESICQDYVLPTVVKVVFKGLFDARVEELLARYHMKFIAHKKTLELPVENNDGRDVGFVDLHASCSISHPKPSRSTPSGLLKVVDGESLVNLVFEVKASSITLGDLMRQLNIYSKYVSNSMPSTKAYDFYFIVAPQHHVLARYKNIVKEQGWEYMECPLVRESGQKKLF